MITGTQLRREFISAGSRPARKRYPRSWYCFADTDPADVNLDLLSKRRAIAFDRQAEQRLFKRVAPRKNFSLRRGGGRGAFELAQRLSYTDLSDEYVQGGRMTILATVFIWYLNQNIKNTYQYRQIA